VISYLYSINPVNLPHVPFILDLFDSSCLCNDAKLLPPFRFGRRDAEAQHAETLLVSSGRARFSILKPTRGIFACSNPSLQMYLIYGIYLVSSQQLVTLITTKLDNRRGPPSSAHRTPLRLTCLASLPPVLFTPGRLRKRIFVNHYFMSLRSYQTPCIVYLQPKRIYNFTNPLPFLASGSSKSSASLLICDLSGFCSTLCLHFINILTSM